MPRFHAALPRASRATAILELGVLRASSVICGPSAARDANDTTRAQMRLQGRNTPNSKMAVTRDDLGRAARKRGIEGQVTTIRHFEIRCMKDWFYYRLV